MKGFGVDSFAPLDLQVPAQKILVRMGLGQGRGRRAHVEGVLVMDHRALAAGIVEETRRDPYLEHTFLGGGVCTGLGERVPGTESHTGNVRSPRGANRGDL